MRRLIVLTLVAMVTAACGGADTVTTADDATESVPQDQTAEATEPADDPDPDTAQVALAATDLGDILVDGEGRTLYLFLNDEQGGDSTCYDDCEANWPPLGAPAQAGSGIDATLLGTVARDDGTDQVTYNGWPLYYFTPDSSPGDMNGQGVGDVWFVVNAAGDAVQDAADTEGAARDY